MTNSNFVIRISGIFLVLLTFGSLARADESPGGISVNGVGMVKGHPSVVEMNANVSGEGELANDASVKYRDTRKKAIAAVEGLKNPDLSIESQGQEIRQAIDAQAQMRIMQGQGGEAPKARVQIAEQFKLVLKGADKLEPDKLLDTVLKIIDTARDAGMMVGPKPPSNYYEMQIEAQNTNAAALVVFKIPDITSLQEEAYKQAITDARAKAERIAQISGVKLGRVLSVQDQGAAPAAGNSAVYAYYATIEGMGGSANKAVNQKEASSGTFGEIPISVHLQVLFEIQK